MPELNQRVVINVAEIIDAIEREPAFQRELEAHDEERIEWLGAFEHAQPEFV